MRNASLIPDALLVDARTAARMLCISERTLWALTAPRGPIPVVRFGRRVRYSAATLAEWIAHQEQQRPAGEQTGEPRECGRPDIEEGRAAG